MAADDDEDDYLNMTFDAAPTAKETSLQRTARLKREAAERGKTKSKAEREEEAREKREQALATELDTSNKGAKMMAKMGFKGGALGKTEGARTRPIEINMKDDRGGIGMESEKKRKVREAAEAVQDQVKRTKLTESEYRERSRTEREERRQEGQWWSAMRLLEGFEEDGVPRSASDATTNNPSTATADSTPPGRKNPPLRSINILWRPLAKSRLEKERERRMRFDLAQSLSKRADYDDPDADKDDKLAFGTEVEEDLDEEDPELEEVEALLVGERLERILAHLREKYHYCFWCKYRYPDAGMEDCPGLTEDEHG
ncbi:G patch domain-containing protein 11 [Fulvia fulva]|uniref:G patch domain-containing protein 11 n=1 Tax=Passalora fulva TaxID=5499 RepID=A0A9Q8LDG8_PASFU|nr:G patch domain-containing protein 11 [Fulvia fulva]KAK4629558.1 G patch domain-containing protein 11 [Fulvia fulva]KAK4630626.1 G patch domain-containing protein 11 [Fulvia fulva]UJO15427.1 G patch domain-containing protein 11 [Fulvia fulva]WPV12450.1 G patch domain-containing protein 11 [Fulvia fulva]WPV27697.1 G patch domain-containing protein 11 [Fulvia fulva]